MAAGAGPPGALPPSVVGAVDVGAPAVIGVAARVSAVWIPGVVTADCMANGIAGGTAGCVRSVFWGGAAVVPSLVELSLLPPSFVCPLAAGGLVPAAKEGAGVWPRLLAAISAGAVPSLAGMPGGEAGAGCAEAI